MQDNTVENNYTIAIESFEKIKRNHKTNQDIDKNDVILVEDSIYNLAYKPSDK